MFCLFEDDERDIKSQFYMKAYSKKESVNFKYICGNGNTDKAEDYLKMTSDPCVLMLDMIPGVPEIIKCYNKFKQLSKKYNYRLIVMPIVCAEYYLLLSLKVDNIVDEKDESVRVALDKELYYKTDVYKDSKYPCNSFERYCKLVMDDKPWKCARLDKDSATYTYYNMDCLCDIPNIICKNKSLHEKAKQYVMQYPCYYKGIGGVPLSVEALWVKHNELVEEFNQWVDKFRTEDIWSGKKYNKITTIR